MTFQTERRSSVTQVIASTEKLQAQGFAYFADLFRNQEIFPGERDKNEKEVEVVAGICEWLPEFQRSFGASPLILTPSHFHFMGRKIDDEAITGYHRRTLVANRGKFIPIKQAALINFVDLASWRAHTEDLLELADTISHEGIHFLAASILRFKSPQSYGFTQLGFLKRKSIDQRLDEAVAAELQREFAQRYYRKIGPLKDALGNSSRKQKHRTFSHVFKYDCNGYGCCKYANDGNYGVLKVTMQQVSRSADITIEEVRQMLGDSFFSGDQTGLLRFLDLAHCSSLIWRAARIRDQKGELWS